MYRNKVADGTREKVFKMFNGRCAYCGCLMDKYDDFEIERIIGAGIKNNLFPICIICKDAKGEKSIEEFREYLKTKALLEPEVQLLDRYYDIEPRNIEFYFEEVGFNIESMSME